MFSYFDFFFFSLQEFLFFFFKPFSLTYLLNNSSDFKTGVGVTNFQSVAFQSNENFNTKFWDVIPGDFDCFSIMFRKAFNVSPSNNFFGLSELYSFVPIFPEIFRQFLGLKNQTLLPMNIYQLHFI